MLSIKTRVIGGVLALVAAVQWIVIEAIAAAAWTNPTYSYIVNYISDLGTTVCGGDFQGRELCSPLNPLMNTSFAAQGVLFAVAAILLSGLISGRARAVVIVLGVVHGIGMVLVGLFHGESTGPSVGLVLHIAGAGVAILAANVLAIFVGIRSGRLGAPAWYRVLSVVLGAGGIVSELVQGAFPEIAGALERGGVYSFLLWQAITGIAVIVMARRAGSRAAASRTPELVSSGRD